MLDFDIIIVTRNRKSALQLSVPLMLSQDRLPANFIVVDASDNHAEIKKTLEQMFKEDSGSIRFEILYGEPGTVSQRNIGLKIAKSPIVFFPDDDALWFDGFAGAIMQVYEMDRMQKIGAVCGTESMLPPPGVIEKERPYNMEPHVILSRRMNVLWAIIRMLFPEPFHMESKARNRSKGFPAWFQESGNIVPAEPVEGFRMTFRTDLIKKLKFDELLKRYGVYEDYDAYFSLLDTHLIARATHARVFHYRSPEKRVAGFEWGFIHIANLAYILCKYTPQNALSRKYIRRYGYYKLLLALLRVHTAYGRARIAGAATAIKHLSEILSASKEDLPGVYKSLRDKYLD